MVSKRQGAVTRKSEGGAALVSFYRFYLLQADDHIARRREDYFADDATAIAATKCLVGDFPGVEIWCEQRKVVTLSREEVARLQPPPPRKGRPAALLISRNKRLLQQAVATCRRTGALRARAADLVSASVVLGSLHHDSLAVRDGLPCRFQGSGLGRQLHGEGRQVGDGLLVGNVRGEAPGAVRQLA
jgi:hypothetical protein